MKTRIGLGLFVLLATTLLTHGQNVSSRSNEFEIDVSNPTKLVNSIIPTVNWITPTAETNYAQEPKFKIKFEVISTTALKTITISIKSVLEAASRGSQSILPEEAEKFHAVVEKNLTLMDGENILEVVAENLDGAKTISYRKVSVGSVGLADAGKLNRTDYALVFATDQYDNWNDLVNPVFDSRTISDELRKTYGFKVEMVVNASQSEILKKIREYGEKKYQPLDQFFIFFAGHGTYDQTFGEGFVVTKESVLNDEAKTTYLSHNRLRSIVNNIPVSKLGATSAA